MQDWHLSISASSFLSLYSGFKTDFSTERYITCLQDKSMVRAFCKFRIELNNLKVNAYRKEKRHCDYSICCEYCMDLYIGDEVHILFTCPKYSAFRTKYLPWLASFVPNKCNLIKLICSQNPQTIKSLSLFLKHVFAAHLNCVPCVFKSGQHESRLKNAVTVM